MEATQDVFEQILLRRDLHIQHPSSMLYRTATNVCLNRIRTNRRRPETPDEDLLSRIAIAPETESASLAGVILERLFQREQPSTRTIAVLHLLDGLTLEEVAEEVGLSVSGVRKRLRSLRTHLEELAEV